MRTVLDASAAVHIVMRSARVGEFIARLAASSVVFAPSLFNSEVANTLWKYHRAGAIDLAAAMVRLDEARALVDDYEPDERLAAEALSLAVRYEHPVYDLLYVVLALRTGSRLLSADTRLLRLAVQIAPGTA